ncbi:MAG: type and secretion system protein [Armatimonadetes bacterium]|jgi:hypothetical protein|nr:type and secretion system protein [Armatimonadota bacterium]
MYLFRISACLLAAILLGTSLAAAADPPPMMAEPAITTGRIELGDTTHFDIIRKLLKEAGPAINLKFQTMVDPGTRKASTTVFLIGTPAEVKAALDVWETHKANLLGLQGDEKLAEFVYLRYLEPSAAQTLLRSDAGGAESGLAALAVDATGGVPDRLAGESIALAGEPRVIGGFSTPYSDNTGEPGAESGPTRRAETGEAFLRPRRPESSQSQAEAGEITAALSGVQRVVPKAVGAAGRRRLLLVGTAVQIQTAKDLLKEADVPPVQVLIEARILEVAPNTLVNAGLEWVGTDGKLTGTTIREKGPHNGFAIGRVTRDALAPLSVTVRALLQDRRSRLLANPSLKVKSGQPAVIFSGTKYATTDALIDKTSFKNTIRIVDFPIGVQLVVFPEVNLDPEGKAHQITARLIPSVSAPVFRENSTPSAVLRRLDTNVVLKDGELLAIGGLINDEEFREIQRVPLLSEIPILGELFKRRFSDKRRSELLILFTARVLPEGGDVPLPVGELPEQQPSLIDLALHPNDTLREGGTLKGDVRLLAQAAGSGADVRLELSDAAFAAGVRFRASKELRTESGSPKVGSARTVLLRISKRSDAGEFTLEAPSVSETDVVQLTATMGSFTREVVIRVIDGPTKAP